MNVFDLPGPEFLVFYIGFAVVVGALTAGAFSWTGRGDRGPALLADPYQIACLRLGLFECARLAIVSLVDRNLLDLPRPGAIEPKKAKAPRGLHLVEQAVLANCPRPSGRVVATIRNSAVQAACRAVREPLIEMGLAPSTDAKLIRALFCALAGVVVAGIGIAKLEIAIGRGRSNIGFLIFCIIAVVIFFLFMALPRPRTPRGTRMLKDLKRLMAGRRDGGRKTGAGNEALLLAAVYGAAGLAGFTELQAVYARAAPAQSSGSSCGSGSSCSSSSCGGGGGCGGCGSS